MEGELRNKRVIELEASDVDHEKFYRILASVEDRSFDGLTVKDLDWFLLVLFGRGSPGVEGHKEDIANQAKLLKDELDKKDQ
jgi:hypothetical protein